MTDECDLKEGSFYWVWITLDPDSTYIVDEPWDPGWENRPMPARFAGRDDDGNLLWNYLGKDMKSDWPTQWIGEEIIAPNL